MDIRSMEIDDRFLVAQLLQKLAEARQVAFQVAGELPSFRHVFEEAEALYARTAQEVGAKHQPVFDERKYVAERIAAGDALYTPLGGV